MRTWSFPTSRSSRLLTPAVMLGLGSFVACGGGGDSSEAGGMDGLAKEGPAVNFAQLYPKEGAVVVTKMAMNGDVAIKATLEGQDMTGSVKTVGSTTQEATYVRFEDGKPVELVVKTVEDKQSTTSNMMGQVSTENEEGSFVGREVREVHGPNGWEAVLLGEEPSLEQSAELEGWDFELEGHNEMYPDRAVNVGESWVVDGEEALAIFGGDQEDMDTGSFKMKFSGYESCNSGQCPVVSGEFTMGGTIEEGMPMKLSFNGKFKQVVDPVTGVSPKVSFKGEMSMEGSMGPGAELKGKGPMTMILTQSVR